jgi:hypothetical protein
MSSKKKVAQITADDGPDLAVVRIVISIADVIVNAGHLPV